MFPEVETKKEEPEVLLELRTFDENKTIIERKTIPIKMSQVNSFLETKKLLNPKNTYLLS